MEEVAKYLKALVHLQAAAMYPTDPPAKPEIVLKRAGLNYQEIAELLGKNHAAVAKAVSRAK